MRVVRMVVAVLLGCAPLAACVGPDGPLDRLDAGNASLVRFESCEQLGDWWQDAASAQTKAMEEGGDAIVDDRVGGSMSSSAPQAAPRESSADSAAGTGTNNQVDGVDESDHVKTDGKRVVTVRGDRVWVLDLAAGTMRSGLLRNLSVTALFLRGDHATVIGADTWAVPQPSVPQAPPDGQEDAPQTRDQGLSYSTQSTTIVVDVDISGEPHEVSRRTIDGNLLDGRMTADSVRLVIGSSAPVTSGIADPTGASLAAEVLPKTRSVNESPAPLVACDDVARPAAATPGMTTLVTITDGLDSWDTTAVAANAETVYATADTMYLATSAWDSNGGSYTDIHAFAIGGTEPARYLASGRVEGQLRDQYSLDEHEGVLRVAVTAQGTVSPCPAGAVCDMSMPTTDNRLVTLRRDGNTLETIGRLDGMGRGEEIKSVRLLGDIGYVVTFRQTDPLFALDLSDPSAPRVLGELTMPGFSSYLHPMPEGRLLGVGSDADTNGMVRGAKVSLYDVSDPLHPRVLSDLTHTGQFLAADDPHAFSWDPEHRMALLPYQGDWGTVISEPGFAPDADSAIAPSTEPAPEPAPSAGLLVVDVHGQLAARGDVPGAITRAFTLGERVITVSDTAISVLAAADLHELARYPFNA